MDNKQILITTTASLTVLGFLSLATRNDTICTIYILVSSTLLMLVCIGGLVEYNSIHMRDFREIYREKHAMAVEKLKKQAEIIEDLKNQFKIAEITKNKFGNGLCDRSCGNK